jgi:tellurite resistance protein TehA-like permease
MGTGIVSVALLLNGTVTLSRILLAVTIASWATLAAIIVRRLAFDPSSVVRDARSPGALTSVAATAVLGTRLLSGGLHAIPLALLIVACAMWLTLFAVILRARRLPRTGSAFMLTVSTESLAALAALLSGAKRAPWLTVMALVICALGVALYPLVAGRFDLRELSVGKGDHWVAGGALAISALASSEIGLAADRSLGLHWLIPVSHTMSTVFWVAAIAWLPILIAAELLSPRPHFDVRRWATVFPVGMYAACSFEVGRIHGLHALRTFASVWAWAGLAVWLLVAGGTLARMRTALSARQI